MPSKDAKKTANNSGEAAARLERASADLVRKQAPQNLEAEQAVLGGIFLKSQTLNSVVDILSADDFFSPAHATIFQACLNLSERREPVDPVTVSDKLSAMGELEKVGGAAYLAELAGAMVSPANTEHYARMVRDKALLRQLIEASAEIIGNCYGGAADVETLLDESEQAVFAISQRTSSSSYASANELVHRVIEDLEKRIDKKELVTGVDTGYARLNELTAGFQPSDLIILAARPSMGKTAFALNLVVNAAVRAEEPVPTLFFSLEMSADSIMQRLLCTCGGVDLKSMRRGFLDDDDWVKIVDAANEMAAAPLYIDDSAALATMEMRARARRLKSEKNLGLIVVDYLQLMRSSRRIDSREQEISDISRNLKALAKEIHCPVIALSQLNRKVEDRTNRRPMLSDLRESGAIEQDADLIMFIYRDAVYNKNPDNPKKNIAEIIVGKQRNGPTGAVELLWDAPSTRFLDYTPVYEPTGE